MVNKPHNYTKGMIKNYHPQNQPLDSYRDAKNIQIENSGGNMLSITNEDGHTFRINLGEDKKLKSQLQSSGYSYLNYNCIGYTQLDGEIIVCLTGAQNDDPTRPNITNGIPNQIVQNSQFSEIGIIKRNKAGVYIYQTMLNDSINLVFNYRTNTSFDAPYTNIPANFEWGLLNFKINRPIDIVARKLYNGHRVVYLTDNLNAPKCIDLDRDYSTSPYDVTTFNNATSLFLGNPITNPTNPIVNDSGGAVSTGAYLFTARQLTQNLGATPFGFISNPIYVTDNTAASTPLALNYDGAPVDTPTAKSITITIEDIDLNYPFIDLAVIRFQGQTNTLLTEVIKRVAVTGNTMTFTYTGTEDAVEVISEDDLTKPAIDYSKAKCIEQKDGVLFLSNLKSDTTEDNWQEIANSITLGYTVKELAWLKGSTADQGLEDYKGTDASFNYKGYQRGEVYSFAFVPVYKSGAVGSAYHIPARPIVPTINLGSPTLANAALADTTNNLLGTFYQETLGYDSLITNNSTYQAGPVGWQINTLDRVRHHYMPTLSQEPHFINRNGQLFIRSLGVTIDNITIPSSLANKLSGYIIARQQRDNNPNQNKRIIGQGIANRLIKYNVGTMNSVRCIASPGNSCNNGVIPNGGYWTAADNIAATNPKHRSPEGIPSRGNQDFYETAYMFGSTPINWGGKTAPRHGLRWGEVTLGDNNGYENDKLNFYSPDSILNGVDGSEASLYSLESQLELNGSPTVDRFDKTKLKLASSTAVGLAVAAFVIAFTGAGAFASMPFSFGKGFAAYVGVLSLADTKVLEAFRLNATCDYFNYNVSSTNKYLVAGNENLATVPNDQGGFNYVLPNVLGSEAYWGNENTGGWLMKLTSPLIGNDRTSPDGTITFDPDAGWNMFGNGNGEGHANESYTPNYHTKSLFNANRDLPDQYGDINQAEYIKCASIKDLSSNPTDEIFGGDTYIGYFNVVNSSKLRYDLAIIRLNEIGPINWADTNIRWEGVEVPPFTTPDLGRGGELKAMMGFFVESTKNVEYRHKISNGPTFWPVEYDTSKSFDGRSVIYDQPFYLGHTNAYNKIYSKDNSILKYFSPSLISNQTTGTEFECRTIYSAEDNTDTVVDNYRLFPLLNYHDIPKNTGPIWDTFVENNVLYLHTPRSLWRTYTNDPTALVGSNNIELQIGGSGLFPRPSTEILTTDGGYAGTISQWAGCHTPFGYVFPDVYQGKIFLLSQGLKEISSSDMTQFFTNLDYPYTTTTAIPEIDNPYVDKANYFGMLIGYDFRYKTLYITNKTWLSYPVVEDFQKSYYTVSYNFNTQNWVSFHDYCPSMYISDSKNLLLIQNAPINYVRPLPVQHSKLYTTKDNAKGVFLGTIQPYNTTLEFVVNDDALTTKVLDSLTIDHYTLNSSNANIRETFRIISADSDTQTTGNVNIAQQNLIANPVIPANTVIARYLENKYNIQIPRETITRARIRGKYIIIKLIFDNSQNYKIVLNAITANYRPSIR